MATLAQAQSTVATAGTLYVDLRPTASSGAGGRNWINFGTLGDFTRFGTPTFVADVAGTGVPGVQFNGTSDTYSSVRNTVADLEGSSNRSIEVWAYNPAIAAEESLVSWGRRGSTRTSVSLNYGTNTSWGASTHFNDDLPWATVPSAGAWHHLVYVYNGSTNARVYVDGVLSTSKTLSGVLATTAANPINIGTQRESGGGASLYFSGYINSVRVHGGALTAAQVTANYALGPATATDDSDADGLPDAWEITNFGNLAATAAVDPDGDGFSNASEQTAGTDPNDPLSFPAAPTDPGRPTKPTVDLVSDPIQTTIADTQPEFSWIFNQRERGESQTAYQIIVSSTAALAGAGTGDVWDSGRISSANSVSVSYGGTALTRGSRYFWRVRTWGNGDAPGTWSATQSFLVDSSAAQSGARSVYKSSANNLTGYNWAGRYRSDFNQTVSPVSVVNKGGGNFFIDFGKAAFGYVTIRLNGSYAGQTLTVRMGEAASGTSVNTAPSGYIRYGSTTVALESGDKTYEARFASTTTGLYSTGINANLWAGAIMPFRYVELLNCPATITAADIQQQVLSVPFDDTAATFASSSSSLDAVWNLCKHSMKATSFAGAYVDGDRERRPYEADAYINQLSHYGVDREYAMGRYTYEFLLDNHTWPLEWRFHFPLMAWADYMWTGDKEALAANYTTLKSYLLTNYERASDGAFQSPNPGNVQTDPADIIDWPAAERDGYIVASTNSISTVPNAFYYNALRIMAQVATVLGNTADATTFTTKADKIQALFAGSTFWNGSQYKDGENPTHVSAHANFFPAAFGLVPASRQATVMQFLKTSRTINGRTEQMPCSVYGAQYYLEALFGGGEEDYAISLMNDNSTARKRHWQNMITEGSTVTMEAWGQEFKTNQDWNHGWGAAPGNIIPRFVLGLKPLTAGFAQAEIKPQLGTGSGSAGLTAAAGTIPTIRGPVTVQATNSPTTFQLFIKTPGNMVSTVSIPTKGLASPSVIMDGKVVASTLANGRLVVNNVPGGTHAFWLSDSATPAASVLKDNWKSAFFGSDASNSAISGDTADPDGDGLTNAVEFDNGTDPVTASPAPDIIYVDLRATAENGAGSASWTNLGTLGSFTRTGAPSLVADVAGTGIPGVLFDGASDAYISTADTTADIEGSGDRTLVAWVYNPTLQTEESLVSWGRRGAARSAVSLNFGSNGAAAHGGDDLPWNTAPSAGAWHHVAYVYSGLTDVRVYVDGVLSTSKTLGGFLATTAGDPVNIGVQRDSGGALASDTFLSGYINRVTVHGAALTASQIAADYALGPVTNTPPTLTALANQSLAYGTASVPIPLTIGDADTSLSALSLSASVDNPALVPGGNIVFSGSGTSRTATITPAAGATGDVNITITVSDGMASTSRTFTLSLLDQPTTWRQQNFGSDWNNESIAGNAADPDKDGIPNLLERAFAGDPNLPDSGLSPALDSDAPLLSLKYRKAKAASDLSFTVQECLDLSANSWSPATGASTVLSDDGTVETIRFTAPAGADPRKFLRVRVTAP